MIAASSRLGLGLTVSEVANQKSPAAKDRDQFHTCLLFKSAVAVSVPSVNTDRVSRD
jgi:hypothetical protein